LKLAALVSLIPTTMFKVEVICEAIDVSFCRKGLIPPLVHQNGYHQGVQKKSYYRLDKDKDEAKNYRRHQTYSIQDSLAVAVLAILYQLTGKDPSTNEQDNLKNDDQGFHGFLLSYYSLVKVTLSQFLAELFLFRFLDKHTGHKEVHVLF
jgi:hypothetical protein